MSLLKALELIRDELPQELLDELGRPVASVSSYGNEISVKGFSFRHVEDPKNFKRIVEGRLKMSRGYEVEKTLEKELSFLNESFSNSTENQLWSGYSVVNGTYISYIVDVGRQIALKLSKPYQKRPFQ